MDAPVLVTGGTGTLGRHVVPLLIAAGAHVRVLTRRPLETRTGVEQVVGDLTTGEGVDAAVAGVGTVVHLAGTSTGDGDKARTLTSAAARAGVRHLVYISVVGADRIPVAGRVDRAMFGYFASKRSAEVVVEESGLPWTTLRATQFHDLVLTVVSAMARLPLIPVPSGVRFQPVDSREVAARLVELASGDPAGLVPDLAGPRVYGMDDLLRSYLRASGRRRAIVPLWLPGDAARAVRDGAVLAPGRGVGTRTWEDFLAERVAAGRA